MPLSNSVIRRYTPPTCTLQIVAQTSPLSRWMGKTALKQLQFQLSLDDPRLPEDKRITIAGDRQELEALHAAVTNYVQNLLAQSPDRFTAAFFSNSNSGTAPLPAADHNTIQPTVTLNSSSPEFGNIYLEPGSGLTHNLRLGTLATPATGSIVPLSLLQLFDLATALDEYAADVVALPNLQRQTVTSPIPSWAGIAAVLVAAVGLIPVTLKFASKSPQSQPQLASQPALAPQAASTPGPIALQPTPPVNFNTPLPTLITPDNIQIPPPAPVNPPIGSTPNRSGAPLSTLGDPKVAGKTPGSSSSNTASNLPNIAGSNSNSRSSLIIGGGAPASGKFSSSQKPGQSSGGISIAELDKMPNTRNGQTTKKSGTTETRTNPAPASKLPNVDPALPTVETNPLPSPATADKTSPEPSATTGTGTDAGVGVKPGENTNKPGNNESTSNNDRLFDVTPQIREAREFFKQKWNPPADLKQTLQYSVTVDVDGTVQRILPIGNVAGKYIDRTGMPLVGEKLVSPNKNGQSIRMRIVLTPEGQVEALPEESETNR